MASIIEGYNYDIFISYRQKDNKGDGWVSEFVEALKTELESTFKEDISVYFDINPHDGLLETHDVDESLKEKLKCLIFIPIISRTYCDPKAFAWEHEFKVFVEQASEDQFGLMVKLPNGNVTSRVLPIRIYELDKADIKLCESVLGGVLRGVEFIHKASGVNRPLTSKDDLVVESGKIFYRDQVNKVANTIKDVLNSLTENEPLVDEAITESTSVDEEISEKKPVKKKTRGIPTVSFLYRLKNLTAFSQRTWRIIALVFILLSVGLSWLYLIKTPPLPDRAELRYDISLDDYLGNTTRKALAISPDGEYLVYDMNGELNLIQLNSDAPSQPISGTTNSRNPFFSPDGSWIGFENTRESKIMKIPITGGNPVPICDLEGATYGINWQGNEIIFAGRTAIYRVPDAGGTPELLYPLIKSESDPNVVNPQLLPDKRTLLFRQVQEDGGYSIMTWKLGSRENPSVLVKNGGYGRYLNSGHLVYSFNEQLYIRKFNPRTNRLVSEPQIIATNPLFNSLQFDFSDNGILVYYEQSSGTSGTSGIQYNLVWVDESGAVIPITKDAKGYGSLMAISSDVQYIADEVYMEGTEGDWKIEIIDTRTGNSLLFAENATCPVWSADDTSIYYVSTVTGSWNRVFQQPLDRSTSPVMLFEMDSVAVIRIGNLSSDRKYLPISVFKGSGSDIGYYDMVNNKVEMLEHYNTDDGEYSTAISPDGKWLAYRSNHGGQVAIYVAPFPGPGQPKRVTSGRTNNDILYPNWDPYMRALYYSTTNPDYELWRIDIQASENDFSFEPAKSIFNGGNNFVIEEGLEIHPNGDRFLVRQREEAIEPRIKVIVNWEQELMNE